MRISLFFLFLLIHIFSFSQETEKVDIKSNKEVLNTALIEATNDEEFKNPMRAGLYSAILPGLGQAYNKKYWKIPFAWGLVGSGIGFTLFLDKRYHKYRDAYIAELNGKKHKYSGIYDVNNLARIQDKAKRNRDYAIALGFLAYMINILDATVDAHLDQVRKDKELKIKPATLIDPVSNEVNIGLTLNFKL